MFPLFKTFQSLTKARLIGVVFLCAALAVLVILLAIAGVTWLAAYFSDFEPQWLNTLITILAGALSGVGGWFMLPALTVLIGGMFQESVIKRVEQVYYPDTAHKEEVRFWPDLWHDIKFTVWALFLNILVLPVYLFGIGFIISILLNAYLLGREFFETAAGYHLGKPGTKKLCNRHKMSIFFGGLVITLMNLVPLLNLFVPILGPVWMVHVYHHLKKNQSQVYRHPELVSPKESFGQGLSQDSVNMKNAYIYIM